MPLGAPSAGCQLSWLALLVLIARLRRTPAVPPRTSRLARGCAGTLIKVAKQAAARRSAGPSSSLPIVQLAATASRALRRPGPSCTRSRTSGPTYHPRSMSFYDTCVAPRYRNGPTDRRRLTGAEAFELEGMDPCYIDIDGFWPKGADSKGPESVPIAN